MALPEKPPASPLEYLSQGRFGGKTYPQETLITVESTKVRVLRNDPNRFSWIMINEANYDIRVSTDPNVTAFTGWILAANGGVINMFWEEDGEAVGYAVYAIGGGTGGQIRVREALRE